MKKILSLLSTLFVVGAICGCAGPEVVPCGPNTYTVSEGGGMGWTAASAPVRRDVYKAANQFCAQRGLVMVPVAVNESPGVVGSHMAEVELTFKALKPGDPEIRRIQMVQQNLPATPGYSIGGMMMQSMAAQRPQQVQVIQQPHSYYVTPTGGGSYQVIGH